MNDRDIEPTFRGPAVGEVGRPLLVRPARLEVAVEEDVGDLRSFAIVPGSSAAPWPRPQDIKLNLSFGQVKLAG